MKNLFRSWYCQDWIEQHDKDFGYFFVYCNRRRDHKGDHRGYKLGVRYQWK